MKAQTEEILTVNSLIIGYRYGRKKIPVLPPLGASAGKGELTAVLGRNGIGKSTLLRTITGLQKNIGGSVLIRDEDTSHYSRLKFARTVGYISTEIVKVSHMRVYDLVALGRFPYTDWTGRIDRTADGIINDSIKKAGLAGFSGRLISELSDGERQRAMIARALAQNTDILIMDEPLAFLDISGKFEVLRLMKELTASGKTIVFSTHDFNIAVTNADKIWLITDKGIIEGAPEDLWLTNNYECLFDYEHTGFNPEDGSFSFSTACTSDIYLEGSEGKKKNWTVKALKRNGFRISADKTQPFVRMLEGEKGWSLIHGDEVRNSGSLYDLLKLLRQYNNVPT